MQIINQQNIKMCKSFSSRKVSTNKAIEVLKRNGVQVNSEQAELILDFLYLLAKVYKTHDNNITC
jgi:hypothetical protein